MGIITGKFHEKFDVLVTPTMPLVALEAGKVKSDIFKHGSEKGQDVENCWQSWSPFTYW
jgi:aspartyl-tRNA(Asn)/glutamyl-tRNA(Gln) amidotransferase subunit A